MAMDGIVAEQQMGGVTSPPIKYGIAEKDKQMLETNFVYHAPKSDQPARYVELRDKAKELATLILNNCPPSRERSVALTELETAIFWANAAIARNEEAGTK